MDENMRAVAMRHTLAIPVVIDDHGYSFASRRRGRSGSPGDCAAAAHGGTHGLYPSRDGTKLYVANRGSNLVYGPRHGKGSVSVIDFATRKVVATWAIPGSGSPDMGNVSADGRTLWLSGRFDDVVYAIDTTTGSVKSIAVGTEPHGLASGRNPDATPLATRAICGDREWSKA